MIVIDTLYRNLLGLHDVSRVVAFFSRLETGEQEILAK